MNRPLRIVHYVNQFFAGLGGENKADVGPGVSENIVGVASALQKELGDEALVVATVFCGDNYMADKGEMAAAEVANLIKEFEPDVVVAGPAFNAGRYGLACVQVCAMVQKMLGISTVTGLFEENPGAEMFHREVIIAPTQKTAAGMSAALPHLAQLALKLGRGEKLGPPEIDGYLPHGYRQNEFSDERGATRAVKMLLSKIADKPYVTEWPVPRSDFVAPTGPLKKEKGIRVAIVTTSGLVPKGNPDRVPASWATTWRKYDLSEVENLTSNSFETIHGGFDTSAANEDPDRIVPVDAFRALEKEGRLQLYQHLYSTVGNSGSITEMRRMGVEIARDLYAAGIDAVIVGAT